METMRDTRARSIPSVRLETEETPVWRQPGAPDEMNLMPLDLREELRRRDDELRDAIQDLQIVLISALGDRGIEVAKQLAYRSLIRRIRQIVRSAIAPGAIVVVVT